MLLEKVIGLAYVDMQEICADVSYLLLLGGGVPMHSGPVYCAQRLTNGEVRAYKNRWSACVAKRSWTRKRYP